MDSQHLPKPPVVLSVVIPARDRASVVGVAVKSVLDGYGGADVEVVLVDDGSTDDTAAVAAAVDVARVRVVSTDGIGVAAARNYGVSSARGCFIAFLDSDDYALSGWTDAMLNAADRGLDLYSCAGVEHWTDGHDRAVAPVLLGPAFGGLRGWFQAGAFGVSVVAFQRSGGYLTGLRHGEGSALWLALGRAHLEQPFQVGWTDEPLVAIERRARPYDAALYYESAVATLDAFGDELRRDRRVYGQHLAIAGVAASRLGRRREALRLLRRAVGADPASLQHAGRWGRALVRR